MPLFDHLSTSVKEKLGLSKENIDKDNQSKVLKNTIKVAKKKEPKKPKIKVKVKDPIEELILIRTKLEEILINNNGSLMGHKMANSYQDKIQQLINVIVKKCFLDEYTFSDITVLNEEDQKSIIDKAGVYFEKKKSLKFIEEETNIKIEETNIDKFRSIVESFLVDGLLTYSELQELELEQEYLNINDQESKEIINEVLKEKELYKLDELIIGVISQYGKNLFSVNDLLNDLLEKNKIDVESYDIKHCLHTSLRDEVRFLEKDLYEFNSELSKNEDNIITEFSYQNTTYIVKVVEEDVFLHYISFIPRPSEETCIIQINKSNGLFKKRDFDSMLKEAIFDGVTLHITSKLTARKLRHNTFIATKNAVCKQLVLNI